MIDGILAGEIRSCQIDGKDGIPEAFFQRCDSLMQVIDSGVVDEYIELSKSLNSSREHALDCILVREINSISEDFAMHREFRLSSLQQLGVDVDYDNFGFGEDEGLGDNFSQAAGCTGD